MLSIEDHCCLRQVNDLKDGKIPALDNFSVQKNASENRWPQDLRYFSINAKHLYGPEFSQQHQRNAFAGPPWIFLKVYVCHDLHGVTTEQT